MIEANKYKLGIFITIGIILIILGILTFGVSQFFKEKLQIYTVFTDSVEGLTIGSPVKYKGVSLGTVKNISICDRGNVAVHMELWINTLESSFRSNFSSYLAGEHNRSSIVETLVDAGMRCSLQLRAITGEKYIEIGFFENADKGETQKLDYSGSDIYYVPSVPTFLPAFMDNVSKTINVLADINFKDISENANKTLSTINRVALDIEEKLRAFQTQEVSNSMINSLNQLHEMANAITLLCNNLQANPSSVIWGTEYKPVLDGGK